MNRTVLQERGIIKQVKGRGENSNFKFQGSTKPEAENSNGRADCRARDNIPQLAVLAFR